MIGTRTVAGHSLPLNTLFTILNLAALALIAIGFHESFSDYRILLASIGIGVLLLSAFGLVVFKGKLMIATVARVITGALFIVSGLIKANDPIGFSYKLKEYFEDGALAYRIKEWFNAPGFSLEFLMDYAVGLSIVICIAEIVLGVLVLIGGKAKLTSWLLLLLMLFFTFLTWHTSTCDPKKKFTDRDTYSLSNPKEAGIAAQKTDESKTNKEVRIISRTSEEVVVDELRPTQCVGDCGCFGDALKGSVGRSLTPAESLWKDIVLLYLVIWIFVAQRITPPNTVRQNWAIIPISLLLIAFFCWVFGWYFPLLFGFIALITALWAYRSGGKIFGNHYGSALLTIIWCSMFVWYCLSYDPLKDYRPYAVGSHLKAKMYDGREGVYKNMLVYRNIRTGKKLKYEGSSREFLDSKIWEKTDVWKFDTTIQIEVKPSRLSSIDRNEFNPSLDIAALTKYEMKLKAVTDQLKKATVPGLKIKDLTTGTVTEIAKDQYIVESYPLENYQVVGTTEVPNEEFTEVSMRDFILSEKQLIVVFSRSLPEMNKEAIPELIAIMRSAEKAGIPFLFVTSSDPASIAVFRHKYGFTAPTFINDENQLKIISRSNPVVMVLKKGVVAGKYPYKSIPTFAWIQTHLFHK